MKLPIQKGAYISQVVNNGPAERAGLRGSSDDIVVDGRRTEVGGDIIVAIDGQPVTSFEDILIYIALNTRPGQQITLTVLRNNKTQEITLELEKRPASSRELLQP
jgi:2-alkenal reductase